jgi:phage shock protein A
VPEKNNKLAGFEALYQVDLEKRDQKSKADSSKIGEKLETERIQKQEIQAQRESNKESNKVSKSSSNTTDQPTVDLFEPTTFKADRRKVLALKRIALNLEPARKLQDLFDEALADIIAKYGRSIE